MNKFGWSYPPGCSGPPEPPDDHPVVEELAVLLDNAGVDQDIIDKACELVGELAVAADAECPYCLQRQAEEEERIAKEEAAFLKANPDAI